MIGLNAVNDSSTTRLKAPTHHKTHKFASGLKDRFYSTGVSGSMQQHQNVENKKKAAKAGLRTAREIHQANVEKELEDDARQLAELEEKLVEIRRQKQIRQERKAARKLARMHNKKALVIQEAWAMYVRRKNDAAVDLIKKFIRTCANKQAALIGGWAAGSIKRFAVKASYAWLEEKRRKEQEMQEMIRKLEEEDRQRMVAYARSQVVESSMDTIFMTVYKNAAIRRKKKSSVLTPQRKRKMKNAHRILEPNIIEQQMQGDRPISPISTPLKQGSPPRPVPLKPSPPVVEKKKTVTPEPKKPRRAPVDKVPSPTRKPIVSKKPNPTDERKRKIAAMHQKRLEDMEIERLRRLERVEQLKLEAEAAAAKERVEKQIEEEEKSRKKVEFMLRLEEQQAQLAREAEIIRTLREKSQKEKEEEDARQKIELKLMVQHDNFYVITPKILGGGNMSLQKRLFSRTPSAIGDDSPSGPGIVVSRSNSSVPRKITPRVSSAPYQGNSRGRDNSSSNLSGSGGRAMEKSVSAGTETFQVPGELSMTALQPSGPNGILEHVSNEAMELARDIDGYGRSKGPDESTNDHLFESRSKELSNASHKKQFAPSAKSEKYLAQHKAKTMMLEANELEKKLKENEEAEKKAAALMLAREQAQKRIADRAKAEREKQLELERQEEQRRLSMESEAAKQAREATRRRVAERTRLEKEKKAEAAELEEERKKKQAELLEKAHVLMVKTKKMTYAMNKMKSKKKKAPKKNSNNNNITPAADLQGNEECSSPSELCLHLSDEGSSENDNRQAKNAGIAAQLNSGTGKALPDLNKLVPPSLSSFGIGPSPTHAGDPVGHAVNMLKEKRSSKIAESKKSGKVSDLLDMVTRAREKLGVPTDGGGADHGVATSAEENFHAAYSAPVRKKKPKKEQVEEKPFKPLTMDEMMKALEGRPGFSMSPLSMDYPSIPVGNEAKTETGKKTSSLSKKQKKPQKSESKLNQKDKPRASQNRNTEVKNKELSDESDHFDEEASGYEDMLNDECERLRAVLEKKMSSSLKPDVLQQVEESKDFEDDEDFANRNSDSAVGDHKDIADAHTYVSAASDAYAQYMNNAVEEQEKRQEEEFGADSEEYVEDEEEDLFGDGGRDLASMEREYGGDAFANLELELKPF